MTGEFREGTLVEWEGDGENYLGILYKCEDKWTIYWHNHSKWSNVTDFDTLDAEFTLLAP